MIWSEDEVRTCRPGWWGSPRADDRLKLWRRTKLVRTACYKPTRIGAIEVWPVLVAVGNDDTCERALYLRHPKRRASLEEYLDTLLAYHPEITP